MRKNVNTQNAMSYSEFLRRVADAIDKSAPKNVRDMNALVSSVTKSMERSEKERENKAHDFVFKNRLLKTFVSLDAFPNYKNWDVFIGEKVLKSDVQNTIFILPIMGLEFLGRNL